MRGTGVLGTADFAIEGITYRPRTPATRATYELILKIVADNLGDVPQSAVLSAADVILEFLKDDDLKDNERKKEIDDMLGV
ncbi:hypothetical protein BN1723_018626, partial [Verticillium longisporum]